MATNRRSGRTSTGASGARAGTVAVQKEHPEQLARTDLMRTRRANPARARRVTVKRTAQAAMPNLAQAAYERIKSDIFEFLLPPGGRFSENEIAGRIGVSRTPVREALSRLARDGFLEVYAKSGWRVRPLDFERFDQLYDVRVIIELAAVRKLCAAAPAQALEALRKIWLVGARARLQDGHEVARLDEQFHATLVAATGNGELARIHSDVAERIRIVRRLDFTQAERISRTYDEHAALLRALLTGKAQQAELLIASHIEASKLEVRKISLHRLHLAQREGALRAAGARA
jgi:DNA-binding GntR family transcriptional regulator